MAIKRLSDTVAATVNTTGSATTTVILSYTIPTDYVGVLYARIAGRTASTGAIPAAVGIMGCFVKNVSGTVTVADSGNILSPGAVTYTMDFNVSGTAVRVRVTDAGSSLSNDWFCVLESTLTSA